MPAECAFVLPGGRKCRCMATRNHPFCRHHGAPPPARPPRDPDAWSRIACWRDFGRSAPNMEKDDVPYAALEVLHALRKKRIGDRTAGRLLRVLLQRCDDLPLVPASEAGPVPGSPSPASLPSLRSRSMGNSELTAGQIEQLLSQLTDKLGQDLL